MLIGPSSSLEGRRENTRHRASLRQSPTDGFPITAPTGPSESPCAQYTRRTGDDGPVWASRERATRRMGNPSLRLGHLKHRDQPNGTPTLSTWLRGYPDSEECQLCLHGQWPRSGNVPPSSLAPPSKRGSCSTSPWLRTACGHSDQCNAAQTMSCDI